MKLVLQAVIMSAAQQQKWIVQVTVVALQRLMIVVHVMMSH